MENFDIQSFISGLSTPGNLLIAADVLRYSALALSLSKYLMLPMSFFMNLMQRDVDITHLNHSNIIPYLRGLNIQLHEVTNIWGFIGAYFTWTVIVPIVVIFNFVLDNFYSLVVPQLLMLPADLVLFYYNYQAFSG
jgi:hypothetical protein